MEWVSTGLGNIVTIFECLFDVIAADPVLGVIFVGTTIVPIGFAMLSHFKSAS